MGYSSKHLELIHNVSHETVRRWAEEFAEFLSVTANPGKGKHRIFTDEDMQVLSLVAEYKDRNSTYEDIHAALRSGQRGDMPTLPPPEVQAIVLGENEKRLALELDYLKRALQEAQHEARRAEVIREENIKLKAQMEMTEQRVGDLKDQIEQLGAQLIKAQDEIRKLSKEVGESYGKGILDALERRGDLPSRPNNS
jgi:DNA-binding transcriptional MerR regulator